MPCNWEIFISPGNMCELSFDQKSLQVIIDKNHLQTIIDQKSSESYHWQKSLSSYLKQKSSDSNHWHLTNLVLNDDADIVIIFSWGSNLLMIHFIHQQPIIRPPFLVNTNRQAINVLIMFFLGYFHRESYSDMCTIIKHYYCAHISNTS